MSGFQQLTYEEACPSPTTKVYFPAPSIIEPALEKLVNELQERTAQINLHFEKQRQQVEKQTQLELDQLKIRMEERLQEIEKNRLAALESFTQRVLKVPHQPGTTSTPHQTTAPPKGVSLSGWFW